MAGDAALREEVRWLLKGGHAHVGFKKAFSEMPKALRGKKPRGLPYTPWQQVEHMRICQWDILEYIRNPKYASLKWPEDYWPAPSPPTEGAWDKSVRGFQADLRTLEGMAAHASPDLLARVPGDPEGPSILHELLLVADHNAYHLGQLIVLRRLLSAWSTIPAGRATPETRATASTSAIAPRYSAAVSSQPRIGPMVSRVSAVTPLNPQMKRYLAHSTTLISGWRSAGMPAALHRWTRSSIRLPRPPALAPKISRPGPAVCPMTPGASTWALIWAAAQMAVPLPVTRLIRSSLSMPFCTDKITVSWPTIGRISAAAGSVS